VEATNLDHSTKLARPLQEPIMGAEPYWYFEKFDPDLTAVLNALREREFEAGRYNPVIPFLSKLFPLSANSPAPGRQHESIEDAFEEAAEDGTRSILDLYQIGDKPDFCTAAPLRPKTLKKLYGTEHPTRAMVEQNRGFFDNIERGHGIYIILYKDGKPDEICFAGYSFD
jgi:hypothetical protein